MVTIAAILVACGDNKNSSEKMISKDDSKIPKKQLEILKEIDEKTKKDPKDAEAWCDRGDILVGVQPSQNWGNRKKH